ncbi:MAG: hypothetical protein ACTHKV_01845 [Flavipsychrobacter sp.]
MEDNIFGASIDINGAVYNIELQPDNADLLQNRRWKITIEGLSPFYMVKEEGSELFTIEDDAPEEARDIESSILQIIEGYEKWQHHKE